MVNQAEPLNTISDAAVALTEHAGRLLGMTDQDEPEDTDDSQEDEPVEAEEPEQETEQESEAAEEGEQEEPETITLETVDDVAKALGVDPNDLMANLKMRIKVNGEERLVPLSEAQKGNQLETDYRQKTASLAEERRAVQAEREAQMQQLTKAAAETAAALQFAEQMLMAEANNPAMQTLRSENPGEYTARMMEHQQRYASLQQARAHAAQQFQSVLQAEQAKAQKTKADFLSEQASLLTQKVPEWSDTKASEVTKFLASRYGLTNEELGNVSDHRIILIALDAMKGAQATTDAKAVIEKKVKVAPKLVSPGKPKSAIQVQAKHIAGLKARAKVTGQVRDAARVIENFI